MLFCSLEYLWFFAAVFTLHWLLPWPRARVWLLLVASFCFYAAWNKWLAVLICATTTADYLLARGMDASVSPRWRRAFLIFSIGANVAFLCYFKYANFFLRSLEDALTAAGAQTSLPVLSVILPVGISFYTFEAINYMVDVYQRRIPAEKSLANLGLFILFFPHLVAGPIVRARDFLPQITRRKRFSWLRAQVGVQLFLMGLFKKIAIADRMAMFADPVFADPDLYRTSAVWIAVIAYAIQIYCDFSGYSDMALGSAHLLGYKLTVNFNMPYLAANISDFWRRWHISLSSWLRDYLFIPLGGSRGGRWLTCRNLLITMAIGGLWHGASWNFVFWGLLHGLLLVGHRLFQEVSARRPSVGRALQTPPGRAACTALTCFIVILAWIPFRATSVDAITSIFRRLFVTHGGLGSPMHAQGLALALGVMMLGHLLASLRWDRWHEGRLPGPLVGAGYATTFALALLLAPEGNQAFIYFQF